MSLNLAENKSQQLARIRSQQEDIPDRYYSLYFDNYLRDDPDLCILSADIDCQSGILAHLEVKAMFRGRENYVKTTDIDDVFPLLTEYTTSNNSRGFYSWASIDANEAKKIRNFIGTSRVVTGFKYDGSLPKIFIDFNIPKLNHKIYSIRDWLETLLDKSMDLSEAIDYLKFNIELESQQESMKHVPSEEREVLDNHKDNLFLSMYLSAVAHLTVNELYLSD